MVVTFRSVAFNTDSPEILFISPRPYGSDLANWLIHELMRYDRRAQPMIAQSGGGWLVRFRFHGASYDFSVRFQYPDWIGVLERHRGLLSRLFRWPRKGVELEAVAFVDAMLSSSQLVSDVYWRYDDGGEEATNE
jgi:hypothetical protein